MFSLIWYVPPLSFTTLSTTELAMKYIALTLKPEQGYAPSCKLSKCKDMDRSCECRKCPEHHKKIICSLTKFFPDVKFFDNLISWTLSMPHWNTNQVYSRDISTLVTLRWCQYQYYMYTIHVFPCLNTSLLFLIRMIGTNYTKNRT